MPSPKRTPHSSTHGTNTNRRGFLLTRVLTLLAWSLLVACMTTTHAQLPQRQADTTGPALMNWARLPDLPDPLGVAGPYVGVHNGALLVAGGANFPRPIWESQKLWRQKIHVLVQQGQKYVWRDGGVLPGPMAYGAAVSTPRGVICLGGNHANKTFDHVFALRWDPDTKRVSQVEYPRLPQACAYGQAALIGEVLYLAGGQHGTDLDSAMANLWALDLSGTASLGSRSWQILAPCPGGARAFNLTVNLKNFSEDCLYLISGRRLGKHGVQFLRDVWEYNVRQRTWRRRADSPRCLMAGTAVASGTKQILVLGGADGSLFDQTDVLKDRHPGFPKFAYQFDNAANKWSVAGAIPQNHVTTIPVRYAGRIVIASGEIRPRVRSPWVWQIQLPNATPGPEFR